MSTLFSPLSLGKLALDNRVIIAPMCQYSADNGKTTDWHPMHLGNLAQSGAGLLSESSPSRCGAGTDTPSVTLTLFFRVT